MTARVRPRATSVRCMMSAAPMPSTNWIETEITVMMTVCTTSCQNTGALSTCP